MRFRVGSNYTEKSVSDECEEAGCSRRATTEWNGRQICADHYDKYRDEKERRHVDLDG